jgi:solute carrier family 25 carnitine/acylcarnitine transporter 20/29
MAGHPFDTLKVRLQTSNQYKGLADCFRQTIAKDGIRALYRGMTAPIIGVTPMFALSFWSYDIGQKLVKSTKKDQSAKMSMLDYSIAGGFSAIPTTVVTTPMERIKVIMQTQDQVVGGKKYTGMLDCGKDMIKEGGIKSLYRGTVATLARVFFN